MAKTKAEHETVSGLPAAGSDEARLAASGPDYTALEFPGPGADRPYLYVNMVSSADGRAQVDGTEGGLGSPADKRLMRELRLHADVVMTGATTLRATGTSPRVGDPKLEALRERLGKPRVPLGAVLSATGALPLDRLFFTATDFDTVIYLAESAPESAEETIRATGRRVFRVPDENSATAMFRHMRQELGVGLVLSEGGPGFNDTVIREGVVDELFLTLAGKIAGGGEVLTIVRGEGPVTRDGLRPMKLVHAIANEVTDEVYLRYRMRR